MEDLCTSCIQPITNPICPSCLAEEVVIWLRDKETSKNQIKRVREEFKRLIQTAEDIPSTIECIVCGCNKVSLCTYCFTLKVVRIMRANVSDDKVLEDFDEEFNTAIWTV